MLQIWPHVLHASYLSTSREALIIQEHLTGWQGKHPATGFYLQQRSLAADLTEHHIRIHKAHPEGNIPGPFFPFLLSAPASHLYPTPRHLVKDACSLDQHLDLTWLIEFHIAGIRTTFEVCVCHSDQRAKPNQVYPSA